MPSKHPEQREGELYLGNIDFFGFHASQWATKRLGDAARCTDGKPIEPRATWPLFILRSEVEGRIKGEEAAKGPNHEETIRIYRDMLADGGAK